MFTYHVTWATFKNGSFHLIDRAFYTRADKLNTAQKILDLENKIKKTYVTEPVDHLIIIAWKRVDK